MIINHRFLYLSSSLIVFFTLILLISINFSIGESIIPINKSYNILNKWGTNGTTDSQFVHPTGIAIDSLDKVYIVDSGNNRIEKFDSNNKFLNKWV